MALSEDCRHRILEAWQTSSWLLQSSDLAVLAGWQAAVLAVLADQNVKGLKAPAAGPIRRLQSSDLAVLAGWQAAVLAVLADQNVKGLKAPAAGPIRRLQSSDLVVLAAGRLESW